MLVCTFAGREPSADSGRRPVMGAYREALDWGYRLYSFGDAMFLS